MQLSSAAAVWRLARRRPLVLLYHRVADVDVDPWGLAVRPADFERHIRLLSQFYRIVSLASLVKDRGDTEAPHARLAITFDDGYRDNLEDAWPILERYRAPATFFISCAALDSNREFWWDALERLLLRPGTLPPALSIESDGDRMTVGLGDGHYTQREFELHKNWIATDPAPTVRHRAFLDLWSRIRDMNAEDRGRAMDDLCAQGGIPSHARSSHRTMAAEDVRRMSASALVEIGAHTISHGRLAAAAAVEQHREIGGSKAQLEAICQKAVTSFSYPFGGRATYSSETIDIVRAAGFARACAVDPSALWPGFDRWQTPRCFVPPGGTRTLLRHMAAWAKRSGEDRADRRPP